MSERRRVLEVALGPRSYPIHIGTGTLDDAGEILAPLLHLPRVVLVTDENLNATRHPARVTEALARAGVRVHELVLPPGERSKSMAMVDTLLGQILDLGVERKVGVVALGGGVIGDLAGFAAAILLRGVDFYQIPTTLLAQVDSAIGGKTGVNAAQGKNLIGAFHQPRAVLIDTTVLHDLPERELRAGYAELVKHAIIDDATLFDRLDATGDTLLRGPFDGLHDAIARSLAVKARIVGEDERELTGTRALLNFGHTFAHAYETLNGYDGSLLHGEAVAIGMIQAMRLSASLGLCTTDDVRRVRAHFTTMRLPRSIRHVINRHFEPDLVAAAMSRDKKVEDGRLAFVLSRGIGSAALHRDVRPQELRAVLSSDD